MRHAAPEPNTPESSPYSQPAPVSIRIPETSVPATSEKEFRVARFRRRVIHRLREGLVVRERRPGDFGNGSRAQRSRPAARQREEGDFADALEDDEGEDGENDGGHCRAVFPSGAFAQAQCAVSPALDRARSAGDASGMTRCWIRNTGAVEAAGPFTVEELRGLIRADLIPETAAVSLSAYEGFRPIVAWPELIDALTTPGARTVRGAGDVLRTGHRSPMSDDVSPGRIRGEGRGSTLRLGRPHFEAVNAGDTAVAHDMLRLLRDNLAAEAPKAIVFPPWYRRPVVRNLMRLIPVVLVAGAFIGYGIRHLDEYPPVTPVCLIALGGALIGCGVWFVFFIAPAHWGTD